MVENKTHWQMIEEAIDQLGGAASRQEMLDRITTAYPRVNRGSVDVSISMCTVNMPGRVNFPENQAARSTRKHVDILFSPSRARFEKYDPKRHGEWGIEEYENRKFRVKQFRGPEAADGTTGEASEAGTTRLTKDQLRDLLVKDLDSLPIRGRGVSLYEDNSGAPGVAYYTPAGVIDVLAVDDAGDYVVFDLGVSDEFDSRVSKSVRQLGWVKMHLAVGRRVTGVIVVDEVDENLKYAARGTFDICLAEYEVNLALRPIVDGQA